MTDKRTRAPAVSLPAERIAQSILLIRGQKVMLDSDLAQLYAVPTKRLNEQVKRNAARFPEDFMFRLTAEEVQALNRSQFAAGSQKHRDARFAPYAFTEHGAIQAANVLNSDQAAEMSVHVVRAFVKLREMLLTHKELAAKLAQLERKLGSHDQAIAGILDAIRNLMAAPQKKKRPIGFITPKET
jgi:ORF6N domain